MILCMPALKDPILGTFHPASIPTPWIMPPEPVIPMTNAQESKIKALRMLG